MASVSFVLDGQSVEFREGESILQAATRLNVAIPHLCYSEGMRADGNCRACMVEIEGERVLQPSCVRKPEPGMVVHATHPRARAAQRMVLELLQSDQGSPPLPDCELSDWVERMELGPARFQARTHPPADPSHPAIRVQLDRCIQCTRCVRACREVQHNDVIGYAGRGAMSEIVFDGNDPMGASTCVGCGECVQACPTGALQSVSEGTETARSVDSVCPYCGVGCLLRWKVEGERIVEVEGRNGPSNKARLCVKGRYGYDYLYHSERLTHPLIRKAGTPKPQRLEECSEEDLRAQFREATWEEALDLAAGGLNELQRSHGPRTLAGFGSAKGSNEEAYLFQKLVRCAFGSNQVDHCTRLCHASSVVALLEGIGSAAVSNPVRDVAEAEVVIVIGANPTVNHPVAATFIKDAANQGQTLIVLDPRRTELARHADHFLQFNPDTDVALLNGLIYSIIEQDLVDPRFITERTEGYEALKRHVQDYAPARVQSICGIDAEVLADVARCYASANTAMIFWGMGISQHIHGTDNARCLIALALITGQIGRRGTGLHPLRGQNNVQGASDVGLIPMVYPDYQRVDDPEVRARFEKFWGQSLDPTPGRTVVEILQAAYDREIRGMYILGENPAMSDPNLNHARAALAKLDHLVVQDLFLTETAAFADVILPASAAMEKIGTYTNTDRCVQLGRPAHAPPGEARQDLWIIQQLATRMGQDWGELAVQDVFEEMRQCMGSIRGISWERLVEQGSVTYPCATADSPGQEVLFVEDFPTESGKARLVPATFTHAAELPDEEYPCILITGRMLEHWHTGAMTRRASVLDALEPGPVAFLAMQEMQTHRLHDGMPVRLVSRRGQIECEAHTDEGLLPGQVFVPFCYREAAANLLTNAALDPDGKIPEFKFCALQVEAVSA